MKRPPPSLLCARYKMTIGPIIDALPIGEILRLPWDDTPRRTWIWKRAKANGYVLRCCRVQPLRQTIVIRLS